MHSIQIETGDYFNMFGRNGYANGKWNFFWTGSGIEFQMTGSELFLETNVETDVLPPWISVEINDTMIIRRQLERGQNKVCLFSGLSQDDTKKIRIRKESPAMFEDQDCFFSSSQIWIDGNLEVVQKHKYKIEVIGDSITSGEGLAGSQMDIYYSQHLFSAKSDCHYAEIIAKKIKANTRIVSQSGWGVYSSHDNNTNNCLPKIYPYVCGVLKSESARRAEARDIYRDDEWKPDVIIINLGTNDAAAYKKDKNYNVRNIEEAVFDFLIQIRKNNPCAPILWGYGMMGNQVEEFIKAGIAKYRKMYDDELVKYVLLKNTLEHEQGSLGHPGQCSHIEAARILGKQVKIFLKQKQNQIKH